MDETEEQVSNGSAASAEKTSKIHSCVLIPGIVIITAFIILGIIFYSHIIKDYSTASRYPILDAIEQNDMDRVEDLLREKPDLVNFRHPDSNTPLYCAVMHEHAKIVLSLLQKGAPVNMLSNSETCLCCAARNGNLEIMKILIEHGAEVNKKDTLSGDTALFPAAARNNVEAIELLMSHGAEVNVKNNQYKSTPLHMASYNGSLDAVKILILHGAIVEAGDMWGRTPLSLAEGNGKADVADYLRTAGETEQ